MNQKEELDQVMQTLAQFASINGGITSDNIYIFLKNYGLDFKNVDKRIEANDLEQIYNILEQKSSERKVDFVLAPLDEGWNFFSTNMNHGGKFDFQWKVYIPLLSEHYGFAVKNIISFLANNGFISECLFSGTMRSATMIVNLTDPDDVTLLNKFIDGNIYLKGCLGKHQPFVPDFNGIGVLRGYDNDTSFTQRVANYLSAFINACQQAQRLDLVTIDEFYKSLKYSLKCGSLSEPSAAKQVIGHLDVILNGLDYVYDDCYQNSYRKSL